MNEEQQNALNSVKEVYIVGIGGIGTSAFAQLLEADGVRVSGEDLRGSAVTEMLAQKDIAVALDSRGAGLETAELLVYSSAVPAQHPARVRAQERGIPQLQYFEALGAYMEQYEYAIAVSGTHGKTTTTAMVASVLIEAGFNPTAVVGSLVKEFDGSNARVGSPEKKYIVVEACEHEAHMLHLHPNVIVVNNIEADHLDYYRDINHITETFQQFVDLLPNHESSALIVNADDDNTKALQTSQLRMTFAVSTVADTLAADWGVDGLTQFFTVENQKFTLHVPGQFNVSNALAAISVAKHLGIGLDVASRALAAFRGTWRRFEYMGEYEGAIVISDYAHHPSEVRKTIRAAKDFYPKKRIVVVFQPHQRARTRELFSDFLEAFYEADYLIIQEIYDVAGREKEYKEDDEYQNVTSQHLVDALENQGRFATYTPNAEVTAEALFDAVEKDDLILIMGAGDIHQLAEQLTTK
jgi:UDP-N-acetylmuramate--alanine ligase